MIRDITVTVEDIETSGERVFENVIGKSVAEVTKSFNT